MKKMLLVLAAVSIVAGAGYSGAFITNRSPWAAVGYQNDPYAAQISADAFNYSVKQRMSIARLGVGSGGSYASAALSSDDALGATPSSRSAYASNGSSRQIDCVYNNGFTLWGDAYAAWGKQNTRDVHDGYKYRVAGPALGVDWSNGAFTAGLATTYNWGDLEGRSINHNRDTRTFGLTGYGQWTNGALYVNGTVGYSRNRYEGDHNNWFNLGFPNIITSVGGSGKHYSNSWNANVEVGYKFLFRNFSVTPNVGLRYFHDDGNSFTDSNLVSSNVGFGTFPYWVNYTPNKYHVLELPVGATLGYEIRTGTAVIVPQFRFAYVPELDRNPGQVDGFDNSGDFYSLRSADRNKNGFLLGTGVQAKFNQTISAHLDYNVTLRSKAYEHHLNLGVGFTF